MAENYRPITNGKAVTMYTPSTSEILLEDLCKKFNTKLLDAELNPVNGYKIVRVSKPVIIDDFMTNRNKLLQCQYTRFEPFFHNRAFKAYKENTKKKNAKKFTEEVENDFEKFRARNRCPEVVMNPYYMKELNVHRWGKELYFAVWDVTDDYRGITDDKERQIEPFKVHDVNTIFDNKFADLHMTLSIEPFFVMNQQREDTSKLYDTLRIAFPKTDRTDDVCMRKANNAFPLDKIIINSADPKSIRSFEQSTNYMTKSHEIHSKVSRSLTMSFIMSYLGHYCLGEFPS